MPAQQCDRAGKFRGGQTQQDVDVALRQRAGNGGGPDVMQLRAGHERFESGEGGIEHAADWRREFVGGPELDWKLAHRRGLKVSRRFVNGNVALALRAKFGPQGRRYRVALL